MFTSEVRSSDLELPEVAGFDASKLACDNNSTIEYFVYERDPGLDDQNNIFGLYVYAEDTEFLNIAADLVNSNGGEWGYVLLPFNVADRDYTKWAKVFSKLREKKLIPIVQLYTVEKDHLEEKAKTSAEFLDSFLWPSKDRYISVYNEPNDDKFWFEEANASEYARILDLTIDSFKSVNQNFYMMHGAFNVSALTQDTYTDAFSFMIQMNEAVPGIFEKLDGWASHSYPQPNFSGSPYSTGRNSILAYAEELAFVENNFGVKFEEVFITETGWMHAEGDVYNSNYLTSEQVGKNLAIAYDIWSKDPRIVAVTPFTVIFEAPFDHFSWVNEDKVPYPQFEIIKQIPKKKGNPEKLTTKSLIVSNCD